MLRLSVIGTGYLGATHAVCMSELGFEVVGIDSDPDKVARLSDGVVPFFEPGLGPLLQKQLDSGRLTFTTEYDDVATADVHFLCVGTPQSKGELAADLTYVDGAVSALAPRLERPTVVAGKSTVPVGTAARLAERFAAESPAGEGVELAWNPEFLREGFAVEDTLRPDRLVVGIRPGGAAADVLREVYAAPIGNGTPYLVTDYPTAELVKVAANAFLATKISFINAMAEVCDAVGGDVVQLADAIGHDTRIGRRFLNAGLGFGGGCLPKDIRAFMARAGEVGADQALTFLREVDAINMRQRARVIDLARELCEGSFLGKRVAILGAAFKPDSDDVRDSPALNVAGQISLQGANVTVYDPEATANARATFPTLSYATSVDEACANADVVLHLTEWSEFRAIDPVRLADVVRQRKVIDARNALDVHAWRSAGWTYRALGRP
ncbi:MAG: UDPglucose 6-dehydrogenase [Frankiaceae bacterium]|nr:UDPglucose 6-dehydrogenase [Frankiaceae bacterium]